MARTSPLMGLMTLLLDALKGAAALLLVRALFPAGGELQALAVFGTVAGHIFPLWLRFRGGKGVATSFGSLLMVMPKAVLIALAIFVAVFLLFRYVSVASIVAVASLPLLAWLLRGNPSTLIFITAASVLVIAKHYDNICRLRTGTESRFRRGRP